MTSNGIYVYGAGGHGKVVADILMASHQEVTGFVDDNPAKAGSSLLGLPVLDARSWGSSKVQGAQVALGVGDNAGRRAAARSCLKWGVRLVTAVHPTAVIAGSARIGEGTVVMAAAVINADACVGVGTILNSGCIVEHDCVVGEFAHLSPGVTLGGAVHVGELAHLGLGAIVLPGLRVGSGAIVGAGAVVVRDVAEDTVVAGIPARVMTGRTTGER